MGARSAAARAGTRDTAGSSAGNAPSIPPDQSTAIAISRRPLDIVEDDVRAACTRLRDQAHSMVRTARGIGQLLIEAKATVGHGKWAEWLAEICPEVGERQAQRYMQLATYCHLHADQVSEIEAGSLREALLSIAPPKKHVTAPSSIAAPTNVTLQAVLPPSLAQPQSAEPDFHDDDSHLNEGWAPDADDDAALARAQEEHDRAIDLVMQSDDRMPAALAEIERLTKLVGALTFSRDSFQNDGVQAKQEVKKLRRENYRLRRDIAKLRDLAKQPAEGA